MIIRTAAKVTLYTITVVISLVMTLSIVLQSHSFQTLAVRLAADHFSRELNTEIRIRGFRISLRNGLQIEDISVLDHRHAVLFSARRLGVIPGVISLKRHVLNVKRVYIDHGVVQLLTHRGDSVMNLQQIIDHFASGDTTKETDTTPSKPWEISVSSVTLKETKFHLQDENEPLTPVGMDYTNIDVAGINLDITDVVVEGDTINASIKNLSARERCGIELKNLSGNFRVGPKFLKAHDLKILTANSDLDLTFDFLYERWAAYNDFLKDVTIQASIEPSMLDLSDIGFFAPELSVMKDRIKLSGNIKGSVSNFKARNFKFAFGRNTTFWGNISALGLPDVEETFIDLNIKDMSATREDIESFLIPGDMRRLNLPPLLATLGVVNIKGNFTGFYNDFVAAFRVNTALGRLGADLSLKRIKETRGIGYQGVLNASGFDVGKLTGNQEYIGRITMKADVNGKGVTLDDADLRFNVQVDSIMLNHYRYSGLAASGELAGRKFSGKLNARDPNLEMDFDGMIDLHDSIPDFDFSAIVSTARLFELNLLKRDSIEELSASLRVNFSGTNLDNIDGSVLVENAKYTEGNNVITMDRLALLTRQDTANGKSYHLQSDFVDADVTGDFSFSTLVSSLTMFIRNYLASFNLQDTLVTAPLAREGQVMDFEVRFGNPDEVTGIFLPFLRISPGTVIRGSFNDLKESIVVKGSSPALYFNDIELTGWYLDAEGKSDNLKFSTGSSNVFFKKASKNDSLEVKIDTFRLAAGLRQDSIHYLVTWSTRSNHSRLGGFASFRNSPAIELKFTEFRVFLNEKYWETDKANLAVVDTSYIRIKDLSFNSGDQFMRIHGILSDNLSDTLYVGFNKLDLSRLDQFIGTMKIDLDGILSGTVKLVTPYKGIKVLSDLRIDKFRFNRELIGDATVKLGYDASAFRFDIFSQIIYMGNKGTNIPFSIDGNYIIDEKNPRFDLNLALKNLNLKMLAPFVSDFMSGLNGLASGEVKMKGTLEHPDIRGRLNLMRTEFKINYLNVPYSFADVITIDSNAFIFDKITIFDSLGHKAALNGRITHRHFSDLNLDLHVEMDDFAAFNNSRSQNNVFYGKARASGTASITGTPENIQVAVRATNGDKTHVVIPIDLTRSVSQADYIIFVDPVADTLDKSQDRSQASPTGLSLDLGLRVNQSAEVEVFFPDQLGNLKTSGTGNLTMTMTPTTPFSLSGTYTLTKGSFLFQFKNLLRLPMSIREGSAIHWTGDAADANISISAVYKTKAPMKGITTIPEEEGIRIPVETIIRLTGKLMNPTISFAISLPNVEESLRNQVFSTIDTNNATTVMEQAIYLMVMNQFKPVVASSTSGVDVGATSWSLITNQINSMLSQITTNVNVNMNYKPATGSTQQEFDVGISTQLLNDRLLIDGTFGMNSYSNSEIQQSSTIVGDINIEYILTQNRRWRARAFNRTNTVSILNNNAPYTQGVGIKYQRDFANFGELFRVGKKETSRDQ